VTAPTRREPGQPAAAPSRGIAGLAATAAVG